MFKRRKSPDSKKYNGEHRQEEPGTQPPGDDDPSDELSIEELEEAAGGHTNYPPPDPNAAC